MDRNCDFLNHTGYGWPQKDCRSCNPDLPTMTINEPGPIRLEAMADSRRLRWWKVGIGYVVELGKVYIGALYDEAARVWRLGRVLYCEECCQFEVYQEGLDVNHRDHSPAPITHYATDVLGTPHDAPAPAPGLRS